MKKARIDSHLTLRELWQQTGIKPRRLSDIEGMRVVPTDEEKKTLSGVFGVPFLVEIDGEKAKERRDSLELEITSLGSAIKQIKAKHGKTNANGFIECPKCEGRLFYTVAAINGHVWGKCETDDCLSWME
uniref:Uncharacterized protein n=1 Tax=viral metagenome TaxID=1070528 RepID=A0A6M3LAC6_9ZZZZ